MKGNKIFRSAFLLGFGTFIAKILGAIYRVPLTNMIGGYGLGLYQTVFPVYAVLLDFAGAGVPSSLSKIISSVKKEKREENAYSYLIGSVRLLSIIGIVFSLLLIIFSTTLSKLQGNPDVFLSYIVLAPAVFLVAIISCYRGYFQGLLNMKPTAVSQIIEQAVKLTVGLILVRLFLPDIRLCVCGAVFAITVSELVTLIYLYLRAKKSVNKNFTANFYKQRFFCHAREIIVTTVPTTLVGVAIPFSHFIDSFIIVNILSKYLDNATSLYGIFSGVVSTVIGLPVAICYAIAAVAIPAVSSSDEKNRKSCKDKTLLGTFLISTLAFIVCYAFSRVIIRILFSRLSIMESKTAVNILRFSSFNVILLSMLQTTDALLIGEGKLYHPLIGIGVGIGVKIILSLILLNSPKFNIYGAVIAQIACYFTASLVNLNLTYGIKYGNKTYRIRRQKV